MARFSCLMMQLNMTKIRIFISSVQREFAEERRRLCDYIRFDALLGRFFEVFIFEDLPAINLSAPEAYLNEARGCDIYIGLYGEQYGYEDEEGVSPTEREFDAATDAHRHRLIFIKQIEGERHPKEHWFIRKVEQQVVRKSFVTYNELQTNVYVSLIRFLEENEYLRLFPWDATCHIGAKLEDIDSEKVRNFISIAREKRHLKMVYAEDQILSILQHLNLASDDGRITNAALLLFAKDPQKFFLTSEIKCVVFPTVKRCKPLLSYQVYHGSLFEMVDQAVGFVAQHIDVSVGTHTSTSAEVKYEIPIEAITEVIVNAQTHRSYESNGSVQVELYPDRLEVWSPGPLPYGITPEQLKQQHKSMPTNPILAHPVYLAGYIERLGTGTTDVIDACLAAGLEAPDFQQDGDFRVTIWRKKHQSDRRSDPEVIQSDPEVIQSDSELTVRLINELKVNSQLSRSRLSEILGCSERQVRKAIDALRAQGKILRVGSDTNGRWIVVEE